MSCCHLLLVSLSLILGSERAVVDGIRAGNPPQDAPPKFVAAVRRIDELRGQLEFDAAGRLVGVDLASDRVSIGDADLPLLVALPNLKRLRLSGSGITGAGVKEIAGIRGLAELSLLDAQIDNDGLGRLAGLPDLASLSIQRSGLVSDAGLEHLKRLPKLTNLGLLDLNVTDAGLARLAGLPQLRLLNLRGCADHPCGPATAPEAQESQGPPPPRLRDRRRCAGHREGLPLARRADGGGVGDHQRRPWPPGRAPA